MMQDPHLSVPGARHPALAAAPGGRPPTAVIGTGQAAFIARIDRHLADCVRRWRTLVVLSIGVGPLLAASRSPLAALDAAAAQELGQRLRARTRAVDTVAWLGGHEYGVLLPGCRPEGGPGARQRLARALGGVYPLGGAPVRVRVSIGMAAYAKPIESGAELWAAAVYAREDIQADLATPAPPRS